MLKMAAADNIFCVMPGDIQIKCNGQLILLCARGSKWRQQLTMDFLCMPEVQNENNWQQILCVCQWFKMRTIDNRFCVYARGSEWGQLKQILCVCQRFRMGATDWICVHVRSMRLAWRSWSCGQTRWPYSWMMWWLGCLGHRDSLMSAWWRQWIRFWTRLALRRL